MLWCSSLLYKPYEPAFQMSFVNLERQGKKKNYRNLEIYFEVLKFKQLPILKDVNVKMSENNFMMILKGLRT